MKVLFLEDVEGVALGGEIKEVKNGFARNYLIPNNIAVMSTPEALKRIEKIKKSAIEKRKIHFAEIESIAEKLNGIELHIAGRVTEAGDYYGAIAIPQIVESIFEQTGFKVERRYIRLDESIKTPDSYNIDIKFPSDVKATITVIAEIEE
tara:strand:+ start:149 stop:598 length:450 start_codon:yes stop_codon:yes gene_type:complete